MFPRHGRAGERVPRADLGALLEDPSLIEDNARQHARVLAAIERREPGRARQGMIDHVRRSGEITAGWFERDRPPETPAS
jgi:DNA-binding FadR family transcriptional regulator